MNELKDLPVPRNLSVTCRLCLTVNEKLFELFRLEEIETLPIPLAMKVTLCTSIRISKHDMLPRKICRNCLDYVNEWYKFRQNCMKIDATLKKYIAVQNVTQDVPIKDDTNEKFKYLNMGFEDERFGALLDSEPTSAGNEIGDMNKSEDEPILADLDQCTTEVHEAAGSINFLTEAVKKPLLKTPTSKFKCTMCPDSFYYVKDLKQHKSLIHKQTKLQPAGKQTKAATDSEIKLEGVTPRPRYEMKCCEKVFLSKVRFRRHYSKMHPGEKPFMCETCGKKDFISEETLKRHKVLHTGKFRCEICDKTFTCNAILSIHKRDKHENDRPFVCDVCGKRFVTELLMNYHKRFHTGEKKYVCEECGLAVVTSSSLAKHKRIHSNVKPHVCHVCGKGFIIKGRLVEHLRVHTGERPYSCHVCHKGFTMRDKLKRHIRIHSGEKLFSCEYCGNNYSTSYGLSVHLKLHVVRNY